MSRSKLTCAITMGDPAGIGPEIILKSLKDKNIRRLANFVIIGNSFVMEKTARIYKIKLPPEVVLLDIGKIANLVFGRAFPAYGLLALDCIKAALRSIKSKKADVLVTAPVNKHTLSQGGCLFRGHTEYLAKSTNTKNFAMMLIGGPFRVVLATRHIALKEVPKVLTIDKIYQALRLSAFALRKYFGIRHPRLGVCGLNPHAGDEGVLGKEEAKTVRPAVVKAKKFASVEGPLPADTLFYSALRGRFDAVVAMYHDQGLIPLKTFAFHQGVNLTLGLPFARTSPGHGTAYDIAGKGKANPGSMIEAIKLAVKIGCRIKTNKRTNKRNICY